jgi:hypothetical protein
MQRFLKVYGLFHQLGIIVAAVSDPNQPDLKKKTVQMAEELSFKFGRRTICMWERNDIVLCGRDP